MQSSKYLNRKAASEYLLSTWGLKRSSNYLAKLAVVGGPHDPVWQGSVVRTGFKSGFRYAHIYKAILRNST
jgi:hypothetical protein